MSEILRIDDALFALMGASSVLSLAQSEAKVRKRPVASTPFPVEAS